MQRQSSPTHFKRGTTKAQRPYFHISFYIFLGKSLSHNSTRHTSFGWGISFRNPSAFTNIMIESESEVAQSCPTFCNPMDCSVPGSSIHGIFQARILEWVAISFSRRSLRPRDWIQISCIIGRRFTIWTTREVQKCIRTAWPQDSVIILIRTYCQSKGTDSYPAV